MGGEDRTGTGRRRLSVAEASRELGITTEAIRKRIERGTLPHERDAEGHVWILLGADRTRPDTDQDAGQTQSDTTMLISEMRGRIEDLRTQLEAERQGHAEARRLLLRALEKIPPALQAPESPEPRSDRPTPPEGSGEPESASERPRERSWWRFWG